MENRRDDPGGGVAPAGGFDGIIVSGLPISRYFVEHRQKIERKIRAYDSPYWPPPALDLELRFGSREGSARALSSYSRTRMASVGDEASRLVGPSVGQEGPLVAPTQVAPSVDREVPSDAPVHVAPSVNQEVPSANPAQDDIDYAELAILVNKAAAASLPQVAPSVQATTAAIPQVASVPHIQAVASRLQAVPSSYKSPYASVPAVEQGPRRESSQPDNENSNSAPAQSSTPTQLAPSILATQITAAAIPRVAPFVPSPEVSASNAHTESSSPTIEKPNSTTAEEPGLTQPIPTIEMESNQKRKNSPLASLLSSVSNKRSKVVAPEKAAAEIMAKAKVPAKRASRTKSKSKSKARFNADLSIVAEEPEIVASNDEVPEVSAPRVAEEAEIVASNDEVPEISEVPVQRMTRARSRSQSVAVPAAGVARRVISISIEIPKVTKQRTTRSGTKSIVESVAVPIVATHDPEATSSINQPADVPTGRATRSRTRSIATMPVEIATLFNNPPTVFTQRPSRSRSKSAAPSAQDPSEPSNDEPQVLTPSLPHIEPESRMATAMKAALSAMESVFMTTEASDEVVSGTQKRKTSPVPIQTTAVIKKPRIDRQANVVETPIPSTSRATRSRSQSVATIPAEVVSSNKIPKVPTQRATRSRSRSIAPSIPDDVELDMRDDPPEELTHSLELETEQPAEEVAEQREPAMVENPAAPSDVDDKENQPIGNYGADGVQFPNDVAQFTCSYDGNPGKLLLSQDKTHLAFYTLPVQPPNLPLITAKISELVRKPVVSRSGSVPMQLRFHSKAEGGDEALHSYTFADDDDGMEAAGRMRVSISNAKVKVQLESKGHKADIDYENEKPFGCGVCGGRWKNVNGLEYHQKHATTACNPNVDPELLAAKMKIKEKKKRLNPRAARVESEDEEDDSNGRTSSPRKDSENPTTAGEVPLESIEDDEEPIRRRRIPKLSKLTAREWEELHAAGGKDSGDESDESDDSVIKFFETKAIIDGPNGPVRRPQLSPDLLQAVAEKFGDYSPEAEPKKKKSHQGSGTRAAGHKALPHEPETVKEIATEYTSAVNTPSADVTAEPQVDTCTADVTQIVNEIYPASALTDQDYILVVKELITRNHNIFPGDQSVWIAFINIWLKKLRTIPAGQELPAPEFKLCQRALISLVANDTLVKHECAFAGRRKRGQNRHFYTTPDVDPASAQVEMLKSLMIEGYPGYYTPSKFCPSEPALSKLNCCASPVFAIEYKNRLLNEKTEEHNSPPNIGFEWSDEEMDDEGDPGQLMDPHQDYGVEPAGDGEFSAERDDAVERVWETSESEMDSQKDTIRRKAVSIKARKNIDGTVAVPRSSTHNKSISGGLKAYYAKQRSEGKMRPLGSAATNWTVQFDHTPAFLPDPKTGAWGQLIEPFKKKKSAIQRTYGPRLRLPEPITFMQAENGAWSLRPFGHGVNPIFARPTRRRDGNPNWDSYLNNLKNGFRPIIIPDKYKDAIPALKASKNAHKPKVVPRKRKNVSTKSTVESQELEERGETAETSNTGRPLRRAAKKKTAFQPMFEGDIFDAPDQEKRSKDLVDDLDSEDEEYEDRALVLSEDEMPPPTMARPRRQGARTKSWDFRDEEEFDFDAPDETQSDDLGNAEVGEVALDEIDLLNYFEPKKLQDSAARNPGLETLPHAFGLEDDPMALESEECEYQEVYDDIGFAAPCSTAPGTQYIQAENYQVKWDDATTFTLNDLHYAELVDDDEADLDFILNEVMKPLTTRKAGPRSKPDRETVKKQSKTDQKNSKTRYQLHLTTDFEKIYNGQKVIETHGLQVAPPNDATKRRRGNVGDVNAYNEHRYTVTVIVVQTLTGGLDLSIDWILLGHIFPKLSPAFLKKMWEGIVRRQEPSIEKFRTAFQGRFIEAYQAKEVDSINYDRLLEYNWDKLVNWVMKNMDTVLGPKPINIPATKKELVRDYDVEEVPGTVDHKKIVFGHLESSHKRVASAAFYQHAEAILDPKKVNESSVYEDPDELDIARSWVRVVALTPQEVWDPRLAQQLLDECGLQNVTEATQSLKDERVFVQRNKGRSCPGRFWEISDTAAAPFRQRVKSFVFEDAINFKRQLDIDFRAGKAPVRLDYFANEGYIMAVTSMHAAGRISLKPFNVPGNKFGLTEGGYETRLIPKSKFVVEVDIFPTDNYMYDDQVELMSNVFKIELPRGDNLRLIPIWFDIHENVNSDFWCKILVAVSQILAFRAGVDIKEITRIFKPSMEEWEVQLLIQWGEDNGIYKRVFEDSTGWMVTEWWWGFVGRACSGEEWMAEELPRPYANWAKRRPHNGFKEAPEILSTETRMEIQAQKRIQKRQAKAVANDFAEGLAPEKPATDTSGSKKPAEKSAMKRKALETEELADGMAQKKRKVAFNLGDEAASGSYQNSRETTGTESGNSPAPDEQTGTTGVADEPGETPISTERLAANTNESSTTDSLKRSADVMGAIDGDSRSAKKLKVGAGVTAERGETLVPSEPSAADTNESIQEPIANPRKRSADDMGAFTGDGHPNKKLKVAVGVTDERGETPVHTEDPAVNTNESTTNLKKRKVEEMDTTTEDSPASKKFKIGVGGQNNTGEQPRVKRAYTKKRKAVAEDENVGEGSAPEKQKVEKVKKPRKPYTRRLPVAPQSIVPEAWKDGKPILPGIREDEEGL